MINKNTDPKLHEFWEKKLSVNYDVEYERYKKLCGLPYNKKTVDKNYPDEQEQDLLIYDVWYKPQANFQPIFSYLGKWR